MMELTGGLDQLLNSLGIDLETLAGISAGVYFAVELIKQKAPLIKHGRNWMTHAITVILGGVLWWNTVCPVDLTGWKTVVVGTLLSWGLPAGFYAARKNGK